MSFTANNVKELREKTGCGMMDCKKALTECGGDMNKAIDFLREKGLAAATKKAGRIAAEGVSLAFVNDQRNVGVVIEVNSETDFVAKNEGFQAFVKLCADAVIEFNPQNVEELLKLTVDSKTIEQILQEKILTIGENIKIRRFERREGVVSIYNHAEGKIGVLVLFETDENTKANADFGTFAKDIAMQIAAVNPTYLKIDEIPQDVIEHEKKIFKEQIINDGKPENIAEKIVEGRMSKFYKEVCLLEQVFVKNDKISISQYIKDVGKKLNLDIKVISFVRYEKGQGIDKKESNFADEVASIVK